jgi:hypothetical protein
LAVGDVWAAPESASCRRFRTAQQHMPWPPPNGRSDSRWDGRHQVRGGRGRCRCVLRQCASRDSRRPVSRPKRPPEVSLFFWRPTGAQRSGSAYAMPPGPGLRRRPAGRRPSPGPRAEAYPAMTLVCVGWPTAEPRKGTANRMRPMSTRTSVTHIAAAFLHSAADDFGRLAYTEALPDEKATTAIAFLHRPRVWLAPTASPGSNASSQTRHPLQLPPATQRVWIPEPDRLRTRPPSQLPSGTGRLETLHSSRGLTVRAIPPDPPRNRRRLRPPAP